MMKRFFNLTLGAALGTLLVMLWVNRYLGEDGGDPVGEGSEPAAALSGIRLR